MPDEVQKLARRDFALLKTNPLHPSLHFNLPRRGCDIRSAQELLGHTDVMSTTMIRTHVLDIAGGVQGPLDALPAPMAPTPDAQRAEPQALEALLFQRR